MNVEQYPLRLAVVSTPRSGNCWLRHMLAQTFELCEIIVHLPSEIPWDDLPPRAIVQLHWLPDEKFRGSLERYGFRVVVLARHPLDVLISALAFSQHDESTLRWLNGAGGDERGIAGADPLSEAFLDYAVGPRARALLGVSVAWWNLPGVVSVRYEDLMLDPERRFERLVAQFEVTPRKAPAEVAARSRPDDMRQQNIHMLFHVWQAQGSLWRRFLPADAARRICAAHESVLATLGYACDPDESLSAEVARQAWQYHDAAAVKRHLHGVKRTLIALESRHHQVVHAQQQELKQQRKQLAQLDARFAALQSSLTGLGPWSIGAARSLQRCARTFPRTSTAFKSFALWSRRMLTNRG